MFLWCIPLIGLSQSNIPTEESSIQNTSDSLKNDVIALSQYLIKPAKNDLEKVSNLYKWLIANISYDRKAYKDGNRRINRSNEDILKRKKAICWGYASLFKAMCDAINVPCEVISGYGKTALMAKPKLDSPNHAWNSVKIDGEWHLLDATWDSSLNGLESDFEKKYGHTYFLTPPNYFIVNHLPADPDWQLLDCPISSEEYQLKGDVIIELIKYKNCKKNSHLADYENFPIHDKRLMTAIKTHDFNPTKENKRELAHAQIDYEAHLTEIAERLQIEKKFDSLLVIQSKMIQLCETATQLTKLFDSQLENCAYNFFNYAVTLTQVTDNEQTSDLEKWKSILIYFEKAQAQLKTLPQNIFTENALSHCKDYIEYAKEMMNDE